MREASVYLTTALCLSSTMAVLLVMAPSQFGGRELDFDAPLFADDAALDSDAPLEGDDPVYASADDVEPRVPLAGKLLVAAPGMEDPYFAGTVIYMLADDEDGALGVVLNRRRDHEEPRQAPLYDGGPVGRDRVFVLHDDLGSEDSVVIGDVAVAAEPSVLEDVLKGEGPARARVFVGYAGWGPGQLDDEFRQGAWLVRDTDRGYVLSHDLTPRAQEPVVPAGCDGNLIY